MVTETHSNGKQFQGGQKKRRAITIKEGTKIVINPSFPLIKEVTNFYHIDYAKTIQKSLCKYLPNGHIQTGLKNNLVIYAPVFSRTTGTVIVVDTFAKVLFKSIGTGKVTKQ